jgi:hypothetical protein
MLSAWVWNIKRLISTTKPVREKPIELPENAG